MSPNPVTSGNNLTVSLTIYNQGSGTASASTTRVQIKNAALTATIADQNNSTPSIAPGNSVLQSYTVAIPAGTTPGSYNAYITLDRYNTAGQGGNTGNDYGSSSAFNIVAPASYSDLVISGSVSVSPNPVTSGNNLTVSLTIYNQGSGTASASTTRVQIKNAALTATIADQNNSTPSIAPGNSVLQSYTVAIPAGTTPGSYNAYITLDRYNTAGQGGNTGNDYGSSSAFNIVAPASYSDLVISGSVSVSPNPVTSGNNLTVSLTIYNQGSGTASASTTRVQIKNAALTATIADQDNSTPSIAPGNSVLQSYTVAIPAGTTPGSYNAYITLDRYNTAGQGSNTGNDYGSSSAFNIVAPVSYSDLVMSGSVSVSPSPVTSGNNLTVSLTIYNQGSGTASASTTRVQIKNAALTATIADQDNSTPSIAPGNSVLQSYTVAIPAGTTPGSYNAYITLDRYNTAGQGSNTGNDYGSSSAFNIVAPVSYSDLVISGSVSVSPNPVTSGNNLTVSLTIYNQGSGTASASTTRVQIKNAALTATIADQDNSTPSIAPGNSVLQSYTLAIPAGTTPGSYNAYITLDRYNTAGQGSNTGNDYGSSSAFNIVAPVSYSDLVISGSVSVSPNPVTSGNNLTVSLTIYNQGSGTASASTTRVQIKNAALTATIADQDNSTPSIAPGNSVLQSYTVAIPAGTTPGSYNAYITLDRYNTAGQGSNTGNDYGSSSAFNIVAPVSYSDLVISGSVSVSPNPVTSGNNLTVSLTIYNQGSGTASASTTRVQIKNAALTATIADQDNSTPSIAPGNSVLQSYTVAIPAGTTPGSYNAYITLDRYNTAGQGSNTGNDYGSSSAFNIATGPALSVTWPNGGQNWTAGTAQTVIWQVNGTPSSPISYFGMNYSLNGGSTWHQYGYFAAGSASSGFWPIPSTVVSSHARVQIIAVNSAGMAMFWGQSASDFTISAPAQNPVANPTADNHAPLSGQQVNFKGSGSTDPAPGCTITSYSWNFGDGTTSTLPDPSHTFYSPAGSSASYTVNLQVTDSCGGTGANSLSIYVTGQALGNNPQQAYSKDPVNLATGNYTYNHSDLKIPGRGLSFEFKRFYNSKAPPTANMPLGFGWTHSYNIYLSINSSNSAVIAFGDGHQETYATNGVGGYVSEPGIYNVLTGSGDGFTLTTKEQQQYNFTALGQLTSIVDKNGNTLRLIYNGANLEAIDDTVGREITFTYDANNCLTEIDDPIRRAVRFGYDGNTNLTSVTDLRGGVTQFGYDGYHQVTNAVDPRGNTFVSMVYDLQNRVVSSQKDALLAATTFDYDFVNGVTTVTDAGGNKFVQLLR